MTIDEGIKLGAAISIAITGAIIGWQTVLKPLFDSRRSKRAEKKGAADKIISNDAAYKEVVLSKLRSIETKQECLSDSLALVQRDCLERSYCMFKVEHGYCPSGMKRAISDMYSDYVANGYNHIAKDRMEELMDLPEFPQTKVKGDV